MLTGYQTKLGGASVIKDAPVVEAQQLRVTCTCGVHGPITRTRCRGKDVSRVEGCRCRTVHKVQ